MSHFETQGSHKLNDTFLYLLTIDNNLFRLCKTKQINLGVVIVVLKLTQMYANRNTG